MTAAQHCDAQAFCEQIKRDQLRSLTLRHEKSRDETFAMPEPSSPAYRHDAGSYQIDIA
jgi:hypothetical protein